MLEICVKNNMIIIFTEYLIFNFTNDKYHQADPLRSWMLMKMSLTANHSDDQSKSHWAAVILDLEMFSK